MNLPELSVRRPVFALMLTLGLVLLGAVSATKLEMKLDPDMEFPIVYVVTELRGASPVTIESEVSDVLEEQINSVEGIRTLSSISTEGLSRVMVEFGSDYDIDVKVQEVRDKVALARPSLPIDVEDPVVQKVDLDGISIITVMLGGAVPLRDLSEFAEHEVSERLERLPGVGGVTIVGGREREIRVWLDPLRLSGYDLSIGEVAQVLRAENAELAGGRIEGAQREWSVTTQGKVRSVEDFGELILSERGGRLVRLRDVAVVEDGLAEERTVARLNGEPGVALKVRRQAGADIVTVARLVRSELAAISEDLPAAMQLRVSQDYARFIEDWIVDVFMDMLIASLLVIFVVLVFLRNFRSTIISAVAIPASVISSFTLFYALDLSLNSITLIALSLSIGLVIDDAIVVLESIYRRRERGDALAPAAVRGANEVALAVVSTTLAVCAVFVPIAFMDSVIGQYFYEFGVAVAVAVCVSTLVALTLTPMLASRWLEIRSEEGKVFAALRGALDACEAGYLRVLKAAVRHKGVTVGLAALSIVGGCGVASTLPFNLYEQDDLNEVAVHAKLPVGTPLAVTNRVMRRMETALASHPYVLDVFAAAGSEVQHEPNRLKINGILTPKGERDVPLKESFGEFRALMEQAAPEAEQISVGFPEYGGESFSSGQFGALSYSLRGPDLSRLAEFSQLLAAKMEADPSFADVSTSYETGRPQISLEVERDRAADLGVPAAELGRTIRTLLAGEKVGSYEEGGRRYDVRIQVLPEFRDEPANLHLVRIRSRDGQLVPLTNAVRLVHIDGPIEIQREDRARTIVLSANPGLDVPLSELTQKLERWGAEVGIEPPFQLVADGSARQMAEMGAGIVFAFGLSLAAIYMVLASLFNSLTQPFAIMMSAPFSFIGGFLALKLAGMPIDMMSGIGLLVLMGLVMKNGILVVDYINQLRAEGLSKEEEILRAGPVRTR